jgi:hypothetical protein
MAICVADYQQEKVSIMARQVNVKRAASSLAESVSCGCLAAWLQHDD